jgi:putative phosphoribosyl transferase
MRRKVAVMRHMHACDVPHKIETESVLLPESEPFLPLGVLSVTNITVCDKETRAVWVQRSHALVTRLTANRARILHPVYGDSLCQQRAHLCRHFIAWKLALEEVLMIFANRSEAGRGLAWRLEKYIDRNDVVVLAVPRGGVPVAFEIARALHAPLDVFLVRKLGVPGHPELAFGAIAMGGVRVLDRRTLRRLQISQANVARVTVREQQELVRDQAAYCGDQPSLSVAGKTVILVDDGIATAASMLAGIRALRELRAAQTVVAVPVAPPQACVRLAYEVDEVVCVAEPEHFDSVGQFYDDFSQIENQEVIDLLAKHRKSIASRAA